MFTDLEAMMKKQGATAKTINAVMGRAYKETLKLETEGEAATADFLETLGCSDVERVLQQMINP
jgi:hypothetical protein